MVNTDIGVPNVRIASARDAMIEDMPGKIVRRSNKQGGIKYALTVVKKAISAATVPERSRLGVMKESRMEKEDSGR